MENRIFLLKRAIYCTIKIYRTPEFREWFDEQTEKARVQIDDRLSRIQEEGYFGDHKSVEDVWDVCELKWKNGRRVYYTYIQRDGILLLLGGNKNGQSKDIHKAASLCKKYID